MKIRHTLTILYWRIFKRELYGAYVMCCELNRKYHEAKRLHRKYKDIQRQLYEARAILECKRVGK